VEKSLIQAYEGVAEKLGEYQGEEFALITSPRGTNEDNYVAQKFTRAVMGSNNIDVSSNLMPELKTVLGDVTGVQAATNPVMELENSKGFLVVSSNITEEQNVVAIPIKKAVKNGASLIVIDPRETELTRYSNLWLRPRPGTEVALIGGILKVIVDESLDDHQFLASRAEGLREFKNSLWEFDIIAVSDMTEVSHQDIREAARIFAKSRPASVLYSLETVPPELRDACVRGVINLAMVTGNVGKSSS
jgi:predicted molibdopterin-dependent oxidoreductase YjgC